MKEKYNNWNLENIKRIYKLAKELHGLSAYEQYDRLPEKYAMDGDAATLMSAFTDAIDHNIELDLEEKEFYRIGEPRMSSDGTYRPSWNYADNKPELGISVVTSEWLESFKAIFFGAHDDEKLVTRGVYKIKGVQITTGGDDEPLIYATDWAEKTEIKTFEELKKAVQ